jgi:hypothetical protein
MPLVPSVETQLRVEIFPFGQVIRAGNRLRLTVEAPTVKPEMWGFAAIPAPAQNTIFTALGHESTLNLPLVPLAAGQTFPAERACGTIRNQPCRPLADAPVVPEVPMVALIPLVGIVVFVVLRLRRRAG